MFVPRALWIYVLSYLHKRIISIILYFTYSKQQYLTSLTVYICVMMDTLIISLCLAIIYQQKVLIYTFKNIGYEDNPTISNITFLI